MNWPFIIFNATFSAIIILSISTIAENFAVPMEKIVSVPIYTFIISIILEKIKVGMMKEENNKRD